MRRWLLLIVLVTAAVGAGIWYKFSSGKRVHLEATQETDSGAAESVTSMRQVLESPLEVQVMEINGPSECGEYWRQTLKLSLTDWLSESAEMGFAHPQSCFALEEGKVADAAQLAVVKCQGPESKADDRQKICQQALLNYRTLLADSLSRERKNYLDMPLPLLITKVYAEVLTGGVGSQRSVAELLSMVEALRSRDGAWYPALKLGLAALFLREISEEDQSLKPQLSQKVNELIDVLTAMNNSDGEILEVELLRQLNSGSDGYGEIEDFAHKQAQSAEAQYYWAAVQCREGHREGCLTSLDDAIRLAPQESRYQKTKQSVESSSDPGQSEMFSLRLSFDILSW